MRYACTFGFQMMAIPERNRNVRPVFSRPQYMRSREVNKISSRIVCYMRKEPLRWGKRDDVFLRQSHHIVLQVFCVVTMVNKGLQPLCLFLAIFPSVCCVVIVAMRMTMRVRKGRTGIGKSIGLPCFRVKKIDAYTHLQKICF
jgi:hypothetical protein